MTPVGCDRIKILLVDDDPFWAMAEFGLVQQFLSGSELLTADRKESARLTEIPAVHPSFAKHFELKLVESIEAAKEFLDLSLQLEGIHPHELTTHGWVPEIVGVDYRLDQRKVKSEVYGDDLWRLISPLPSLRDRAAQLGLIRTDPGLDRLRTRLVPLSRMTDKRDIAGCFAGGLIAMIFKTHPTVPIPTTVLSDDAVVGRDGVTFEWLLNTQFFGAYSERGAKPSLESLLRQGVANLRRRIAQLAANQTIWISYDDLTALAESPTATGLVLRVRSRYGTRRYPAEALFLTESFASDLADPTSFVHDSPQEKLTEAQKWARRLLTALKWTAEDGAARQIAESIWGAYCSTWVEKRHRLSQLSKRATLDETEKVELSGLEALFAVKAGECSANVYEVRSGDHSSEVRRWSALFLLVRLSKLAADAGDRWRSVCDGAGISSGIAPDLERHRLTLIDAYLVLFPVPTKPVVLTRDVFTDNFSKSLMRLTSVKKVKGDRGDIALDVSDVLNCRPWSLDGGTNGLRPGELYRLQCFAKFELGFEEIGWPKWLIGEGPRAGHMVTP